MSSPREDDRIYPKTDQESEAQAFLEVYDVLQTLIKSKSLLIHLSDVKNALIPTISTSNQFSEEILERSITKQLYQQYKASKLLEFKEHFTQTESWRYFPAMYRSLRTRMLPQVNLNVLSNHPEIKAIVKNGTKITWNFHRVNFPYKIHEFNNTYWPNSAMPTSISQFRVLNKKKLTSKFITE